MAITRPVTKTKIQTAEWGIPITDAVNANTSGLAALQPSAFVTVTTLNGWIQFGASPIQYRKMGDMVQVRGRADNASGQAFITVFNLPVGFRPKVDFIGIIGTVANSNWGSGAMLVEASTGNCNVLVVCQSLAPTFQFSTL